MPSFAMSLMNMLERTMEHTVTVRTRRRGVIEKVTAERDRKWGISGVITVSGGCLLQGMIII